MSKSAKAYIRVGLKFSLTAVVLGSMITVLAQLAWMATPHSPDQVGAAAAFEQAATLGLTDARERALGALDTKVDDAEPSGSEVYPSGGVHRVGEWPSHSNVAFSQAPILKRRVEAGMLPPVSERLPHEPLVIHPPQQHGPYGGTWTRFGNGPQDVGILDDRLAYEGLVRWDAMGREAIPNLATHWKIEDEGRLYTFHLRKGVRWSDGRAFSTDDILFWYHHYLLNQDLNPIVPNDFKTRSGVMSLSAPDSFTVQMRFKETKGLFLQKLASGRSQEMCAYPAHYMKQFHEAFADPDTLKALTLAKGFDLWNKLFKDEWEWRSTGAPRLWPWIMKSPPPARPILLERNPYYWKVDPDGQQLPYIDQMSFEIFDNETINFKAINGEIGMQSRHLEFLNYSLFLEHQEKGGYRILKWIDGSSGPACLLPNLNHRDPAVRKLIENPKFRIALSHAIDRAAINEIAYFGIGEPRQISPPKSSEYYWETYAQAYTAYDPDLANRMLDEVGLTERGRGGVRLLPDGRPLSLFIETTAQNSRELEIVASNWREVGIQAEIKELARQLWTERKRALTFDVAVWGGAAGQIPTLDPRWFVPVDTNNWNAPEFGRWYMTQGEKGEAPPPQLRRAMEIWSQIESSVEVSEHKRLFRELLELNHENLWIIGMVGERPSIVVVDNDFRNVPEVAVGSWMFRTPGNTAVECYAIDPTSSRM